MKGQQNTNEKWLYVCCFLLSRNCFWYNTSFISLWLLFSSKQYFWLLLLDLDFPILSVSHTMPIERVDNVTFNCTVKTTYRINNYTWYRNNARISGKRAQIYQLIKGNRSDAGNYSCNATTTSGLSKQSVATSVTYLCKYQNSSVVYPWHINFFSVLFYRKM